MKHRSLIVDGGGGRNSGFAFSESFCARNKFLCANFLREPAIYVFSSKSQVAEPVHDNLTKIKIPLRGVSIFWWGWQEGASLTLPRVLEVNFCARSSRVHQRLLPASWQVAEPMHVNFTK